MPKILRSNKLKDSLVSIVHGVIPNRIKIFLNDKTFGRRIRDVYKVRLDFPRNIALSTSAVCQARCIFCPTSRGVSIKPQFMPFELAKKIIDEASLEKFNGIIKFGENGEALLNNSFLDIFSYAREKLPGSFSMLISNIERMDEPTSKKLLSLGLGCLHCNIDGASAETYEYVKKGLSFEKVKSNLLNFIRLRDELKSNCKIEISILSAKGYVSKIDKKKIDFPDDTEDVISFWTPHLREVDTIKGIYHPYYWATREQRKIKNVMHCRWFDKLYPEAYIAANGNVYVCCFDYNAELIFGNVNQSSLKDIWNSEQRRNILEKIKLKKFNELGNPCEYCR